MLWDRLVPFPDALRSRYPDQCKTLDILEEISPPPSDGLNHLDLLLGWLRQSWLIGLLDEGEHLRLQRIVGEG